MEASRVSAILQNMPPKERASVDENRLRVLERELHDEDVVIVARCHFPFGTLVVTSKRLIILLQDGGVDVTRFSDVASFSLIEGTKKLLGGYTETVFNTQLRNGTRYTGQGIGTDGAWGIRAGRAILAAHEAYAAGPR
jgi:hypothetical protein